MKTLLCRTRFVGFSKKKINNTLQYYPQPLYTNMRRNNPSRKPVASANSPGPLPLVYLRVLLLLLYCVQYYGHFTLFRGTPCVHYIVVHIVRVWAGGGKDRVRANCGRFGVFADEYDKVLTSSARRGRAAMVTMTFIGTFVRRIIITIGCYLDTYKKMGKHIHICIVPIRHTCVHIPQLQLFAVHRSSPLFHPYSPPSSILRCYIVYACVCGCLSRRRA